MTSSQSGVGKYREATGRFVVHAPIEKAAFFRLLAEQDRRIEGRRERLHEAVRELPPPVWAILALGGMLTIGWVLLFANRREPFAVQGTVIGGVAALTVASLLLVWFLDHPYEGQSGSILPTEMEESVATIEDEHPSISPPCDRGGLPRSET